LKIGSKGRISTRDGGRERGERERGERERGGKGEGEMNKGKEKRLGCE